MVFPEPLIVGRGINDVAIMVVTLSPKPAAAERYSEKDLYELAEKLRSELNKVDNVGLTYIAGGDAQQIRVEPDPKSFRSTASRCSSCWPRCAMPTVRSRPAGSATRGRRGRSPQGRRCPASPTSDCCW